MKNILFVSLLFLFSMQAMGQFRLGVGFGPAVILKPAEFYATSTGPWSLLISLEPSYRINDNISVGIRWEHTNFWAYGIVYKSGTTPRDYDASGLSVTSTLVTVQYYLNDGKFSPFVGGGLGVYRMRPGDFSTGPNVAGGNLRVGMDFGHGTLLLDLNIIPNITLTGFDPETIKSSYLGLRLGFNLGK